MAIPVGFIPLAAAALTLEYLRRQVLPSAPSTEPIGEPYTPPFEGGQCPVNYAVDIIGTRRDTGLSEKLDTRGIMGAISSVEQTVASGVRTLTVTGSQGILSTQRQDSIYSNLGIANIRRTDGQPDNCGNLANPNPPPPIASDGLANSPAIETDDDDPLVQGAPIVVIPPLGSVLANIIAAVKAATDALAAVKGIADAINAIADTIRGIKDWLDDKNKDDRTKKTLFVHNYGSVRKDGFLRLYPSGEANGFEPVYIDLQLLSIPIGYGKYFGDLSPNFYKFKPLGYISFVSPSFGTLETVEIEFTRTSINVPENAFGFFYHLGLENVIRANVSLFYLRPQAD